MVHWLIRHASNAGDMDMIPGQGTKMSHATQSGQKKKKKWGIFELEFYLEK